MKKTKENMQRALILVMPVILLSACGIKRPLIHPRDIPAYEEKLEKKRLEREEFLREQEELRQRQLEQLEKQPSPSTNNNQAS